MDEAAENPGEDLQAVKVVVMEAVGERAGLPLETSLTHPLQASPFKPITTPFLRECQRDSMPPVVSRSLAQQQSCTVAVGFLHFSQSFALCAMMEPLCGPGGDNLPE